MKVTIIQPKRENFDKGRLEFWEFGFMSKSAGNFKGTVMIGREKFGKKYSGTPLALAILGSLIPKEIDVELIDENVEDIDFNARTDLVFLTFFTVSATRGYQIADTFRDKDVKVVIGGIHASMLPDEAILHADAVAIGEGEPLVHKIIEDFQNQRLQKFYSTSETNRPEMDNLPTPHWNALKLKSYFNPTMQTMRGCPMGCDFCTVRVHWGSQYRYKPIEKVINEASLLKKQFSKNTFFMIVDDDISANRKRSKELFKRLIPQKIRWMSQGSLAMAKDDEFLDLMTRSGGTRLIIGFESLSDENLKLMKKNPANNLNEYAANVRKINSAGAAIIGAFVFGFDHDDTTCFDNTANFILENYIAFPQLFALTPFPGTKLANRLEKEGRILSKDWKYYTASTVLFEPKKMTKDELQAGYYHAIQKVYSYKGIHQRLTGLYDLWEKYSNKSSYELILEKIDTLLINENFRGVAYSFPLTFDVNEENEKHYQQKLKTMLRGFLAERTEIFEQIGATTLIN